MSVHTNAPSAENILVGKWFLAPAFDERVATNGFCVGKVIAAAPNHLVVRLKSWKRHQSLHIRNAMIDSTEAWQFARTEAGIRKMQNKVAADDARTPRR